MNFRSINFYIKFRFNNSTSIKQFERGKKYNSKFFDKFIAHLPMHSADNLIPLIEQLKVKFIAMLDKEIARLHYGNSLLSTPSAVYKNHDEIEEFIKSTMVDFEKEQAELDGDLTKYRDSMGCDCTHDQMGFDGNNI